VVGARRFISELTSTSAATAWPSFVPTARGRSGPAPTSKTDRLDGRKLAEYAASGLLRPIAVPTEDEEGFRALVRRRHRLTDSIRHAKQRIRGLLLQFGVEEPAGLSHWGKAAVEEVGRLSLPPGADETRNSLLRELAFLTQEREAIEEKLCRTCRAPGHEGRIKALKTVPGVGETVATTFAAELFRPGRFYPLTGDRIRKGGVRGAPPFRHAI
jgi:transposase